MSRFSFGKIRPRLSNRPHRSGRSIRRLGLESLESRRLMAVDATSAVYDDGRFLVRFAEHADVSSRLPGTSIGEGLGFGWVTVEVAAGVPLLEAVQYYDGLSDVELAQLDYSVHLDQIPNDPGFQSLWGLGNVGQTGGVMDADIDAPEAWDLTTGSGTIVVGIIDTGIDYRHPDLARNIWTNLDEIGGNGIDDDGNGYVDDVRGWDFHNNDNDPLDDNFHGTHVAGTVGAVGNNGLGIAGVAWNVKLMPLKFLGADGSGFTSDAIRALDYARVNGARIVNNSWGGGGYSQAFSDAIERYRQSGGIFVAAAGNSGSDNDSRPSFPASYPQDNVLTVAATNDRDQLASFSNYGFGSVDIAAPGVSILSTAPGGTYRVASGTSMAAPHVSGAAALVWSLHPEFDYAQVIRAIVESADPRLGGRVAHGRLNLRQALITQTGDQGGGPAKGNPIDTPPAAAVEFTWQGASVLRDASFFSQTITTIPLRVNSDLTIADLNVRVNIDHTWDSDLRLMLVSPTGQRVPLFQRRGDAGDNVYATFDDQAPTHVRDGVAPYAGAFRPEAPLSKLTGESARGVWLLRIADAAWGDIGVIREFSLIVTPEGRASQVDAAATVDCTPTHRVPPGGGLLSAFGSPPGANTPGRAESTAIRVVSGATDCAPLAIVIAALPTDFRGQARAIDVVLQDTIDWHIERRDLILPWSQLRYRRRV